MRFLEARSEETGDSIAGFAATSALRTFPEGARVCPTDFGDNSSSLPSTDDMTEPTTAKTSLWGYAIRLLLKHGEVFGKWGPWVALLGFLVLEWLAHSSAELVVRLSEALFRWHLSEGLMSSLLGVALPVMVFVASAWALGSRLRRIEEKQAEDQAKADAERPIFAHRGLIASVSLVTMDSQEAIKAAMVPAPGSGPNHRAHVLRCLYKTSWGPLAAAVELHQDRLKHVWLLCTPQVHDDFPLIRKWIRFLASSSAGTGVVEVEEVPLRDRNSVRDAREAIDGIYRKLEGSGIRENQVIADMTGGTAAMTAGMILATLDEQKQVEYLSQDPREALLVGGEPRVDLSSVFRYVETSPNDVARAFIGLLEKRTGVRKS